LQFCFSPKDFKLPIKLFYLNASGDNNYVGSNIPEKLEKLRIQQCRKFDFCYVPVNLKELELVLLFRSEFDLPKNIESLKLISCFVFTGEGLPMNLKKTCFVELQPF
jgi:hypothetical protein